MSAYYILVNAAGVYTKEGDFFLKQGGLKEEWGKTWELIDAASLYEARNKGIALRRQRFPNSHRTMGEDGESPSVYWPEARGS